MATGGYWGHEITPRSRSLDDWARAFMDLANLTIGGFRTKAIRARLNVSGVPYCSDDGSLVLLEKLLARRKHADGRSKLNGLREVQAIRFQGGSPS